jgi:tRNA G18 (ribose-2'-O)-methylase SpoU
MTRKLKNEELNRLSTEEFKRASKAPVVVVLDNVRSLNNIGSVFRTADAFRVEKLCLCGITARPPHKDIRKTALGSTDSVEWVYFEKTLDAVSALQKDGFKVFAIEQVDKSIPLNEFYPENINSIAFVFGNEVRGVEEEVVKTADGCIEIPQFGTKHSFNIVISAGIVLWDIFQKMKFKLK